MALIDTRFDTEPFGFSPRGRDLETTEGGAVLFATLALRPARQVQILGSWPMPDEGAIHGRSLFGRASRWLLGR